jgi:tetratricopeptide (TPR) repeat protein
MHLVRLLGLGLASALLVTLVTLAALAPGGCKKENEPDWPYGPPPGGLPDVGTPSPVADVSAGEGGEGGVSPVAPEDVSPTSPGDVAGPADGPLAGALAGDVADGPIVLDEATLVALRRPVAASDRDVAERETERGRALHARLQLREALGHYRLALERMPSHAPANYLAARALALLGRPREALRYLLVLDALGTDPARAFLTEARGELDFRSLWPDETFRRLSGFGTIGVAVLPSGPAPSNETVGSVRDRLVGLLAEAGLPAVAAEVPEGAKAAPVVLHRPEQVVLAEAVAKALDDVERKQRASLPVDVLVLWRAGDKLPDAPGVPLEALLDLRLQARDGYGLRLFRLRSTGFFESEDRATDGSEVRRRRGRWRAEGDRLVLTFEETLERYPEGADVPQIETTDATRTVPFEVGPGKRLVLDGLAYTPK